MRSARSRTAFRHSTPEGSLAMAMAMAMAMALARSGLKPVQVLPMPGEAGTGLHTHDGTSLWDAVLVFRKLPTTTPTETVTKGQVAAARANVPRWRDRFRRQDRLPFNDPDFVNLFRASLVGASLGLYGHAKNELFDRSRVEPHGGGPRGSKLHPKWLRVRRRLRTLSVNAFGTDSYLRTDPRRRSRCDSENLRRERWDRFAASHCPIVSPPPRDRVPSGHVERKRGVPASAGL